jgi:hypothetical protein
MLSAPAWHVIAQHWQGGYLVARSKKKISSKAPGELRTNQLLGALQAASQKRIASHLEQVFR